MAKQRIEYLAVDRLDIERTLVSGGSEINLNGLSDEKAKVSSNDTTAGYLNGKLVAGTNITLTENNNGGNETLTISAAGGVTGFTASQNTSSPNDSVNASRLLADGATANVDIVLSPKGTGSISAHLPNNGSSGGNKRGQFAVDLQTSRGSADQVASGSSAVICGGASNRAYGTQSFIGSGDGNVAGAYTSVVGGRYNSCTISSGFVGGGQNNTITGVEYNAVLCGRQNTLSGERYAVVVSGFNNSAQSERSMILNGDSCTTSASYTTIIGGNNSTASGSTSTVIGHNSSATATYAFVKGHQSQATAIFAEAHGYYALAAIKSVDVYAKGYFAQRGDCQREVHMQKRVTIDATQATMTSDPFSTTATPDTTNTIVITNDSCYGFTGIVTARNQDTDNESAAWEIKGCIDNNLGTTAFVGTPTVTALGDDSAGAWSVSLVADDTLDALLIKVTGQNAKTIRWGATITLMKVGG